MKLVKTYLKMHLKTALEYKTSFILTLISSVLVMLIDLFTVYALFSKFSLLDIYPLEELILGFSTIWLGFSISEMLFRGFDVFSNLIVSGNFDILLIRPRSLFMQIFGSDIAYEKSGRVLVSLLLYIYSAVKVIKVFTFSKILTLIFMVLGTILTILSLFILGATLSFYTIQGLETINILQGGTKQVGEYPIKMYNKVIGFIFTFIIPLACLNYYPLCFLTGKSSSIFYIIMPLVSIIPLLLSMFIFKIGVHKYSSTGS